MQTCGYQGREEKNRREWVLLGRNGNIYPNYVDEKPRSRGETAKLASGFPLVCSKDLAISHHRLGTIDFSGRIVLSLTLVLCTRLPLLSLFW